MAHLRCFFMTQICYTATGATKGCICVFSALYRPFCAMIQKSVRVILALPTFDLLRPPRGAAPAALANRSKSASARQVLPLRGSRSTVYPARFAGSLALIPRSGPSVSHPAEVGTPAHGRRLSLFRFIVIFSACRSEGGGLGGGNPRAPAPPRPLDLLPAVGNGGGAERSLVQAPSVRCRSRP